jgi:translocation protein SEC62
MMRYRCIISLAKDPRLISTGNEKIPKFVVPDKALFSDKGIYMVMEKESSGTKNLYLILVAVAILAMMCFRLWPLWLKKGIWYLSFYLLVFLVVTAVLRLILWVLLYHFGMDFWLFPNYFCDSNDPRDSFLPITSFHWRDEMWDPKSIIFRLISASMICYMGYQFCQDEKNIEDVQELYEHGLTDLFEYGQNFVLGNALGDSSSSDANKT